MELKYFVKNTLVEISKGVEQAQKETKSSGMRINPIFQGDFFDDVSVVKVDFKVAITATDETSAGAGIQVASLLKIGGDIKEVNSSISTVCFNVPVIFSTT